MTVLFDSFSEPIPRKGTETFSMHTLHTWRGKVFQNLFPERGLKRWRLRWRHLLTDWFFRTYSPKGDWNTAQSTVSAAPPISVFQNLFPERGLKQRVVVVLRARQPVSFSEPIPRKGTETMTAPSSGNHSAPKVFQNLFPERGLKLQ